MSPIPSIPGSAYLHFCDYLVELSVRPKGTVVRLTVYMATKGGGRSVDTLNEGKLREAILYFVERANNIHLGVTKLMKLLYFADFDNCEQYGCTITGARYV